MKNSPGTFSAAASEAYKGLDECRKTSLLQLAEDTGGTEAVTSSDVRKAATRIFKRIDSEV